MKNNKLAHIADVHVRFGSRHEEYKIVFVRFIEDLKKEKPRRIVLPGDLFHTKVNMSPQAVHLVGWFLQELSKICPVDVISGNHDENLASLSQGNSVESVINLLDNGFIITKNTKELPIPKAGNPIYFYKDSGFYDIDEEIVYGVYSCSDGEILRLTKREPNKKYIALYHGPLQGAKMDNGYEAKGDDLIKLSVFNNFDAVLCGDFHSYQTVQEYDAEKQKPAIVFCGSAIQQNYGEEIEKGYVMWDISDFSHERRFILNDYGFCKLSITKGEDWQERLEDSLRFSLDRKKTKVQIEFEDDEENYSVEKLSQIEHWIRNKYGCEVVKVEFKPIYKEKELTLEGNDQDVNNSEESEKLLIEFLNQNNYDNAEDVIELSKEIDLKLNYKPNNQSGLRIEFNKMEVCNLFSFPNEAVVFDFDKLNGITGIFGENYNGKSNLIRVLVWILYQKILGGGDPSKLVNMYTNANKAWGRLYFTIAGIKYFIYRGVSVSIKKDGTADVKYQVQYKYEKQVDNEGVLEPKWIDAESEEAATEKKELKKMIADALGTYEDFTKVALQGGREDYLSLSQQPKNDLLNRYLGLEIYRDRYEEANETFKKIKATQKVLGDPIEIEKSIAETNNKIEEEKISLNKLTAEKEENLKTIDGNGKEILELTKTLHKIEKLEETDRNVINSKIISEETNLKANKDLLPPIQDWLSKNFQKETTETAESFKHIADVSKESVEHKIKTEETILKKEEDSIPSIEAWLKENFIKELSDEIKTLDKSNVERSINAEQTIFNSEKANWVTADKWIKENPKKKEADAVLISSFDKDIEQIKDKLVELSNQLKLSKGEKCPTCNHVSHVANPELEKKCLADILAEKLKLQEKQDFIKQNKENIDHNNIFDKKTNELETLRNSLVSKKLSLDTLKSKLELCSKKEEIINHNNTVDAESKKLISIRNIIDQTNKNIIKLKEQLGLFDKFKLFNEISSHNKKVQEESKKLTSINTTIEQIQKNIEKLNGQIVLLDNNEKFLKENDVINKKIASCDEDIKIYKTMNLQVESKIKESSGNIRVWENNVETLMEKLNQIKESDRVYKKYSVYLQAVGRDGVPGIIIRKKLPIINHKINSLLKEMVEFKVEMYMKSDGDVKENFYFSDAKTDTLPMSMGSGSQKFMTSIAISDALHFVSSLIKPSIRAIDEGFDTLSNSKLMELNNLFSYLRSKYKNVFVITHKTEVKDFVEHVIEVSKTTSGLTTEQLASNPNAGISRFNIS